MTFFSVFDIPVFWPILLLYWFVLFFVTMKRQIRHMIKYRYIPFTFGKKVRMHALRRRPCGGIPAVSSACMLGGRLMRSCIITTGVHDVHAPLAYAHEERAY